MIVGISDYQTETIPDLQFAHKDAEIFSEYLQSKAGGELGKEQIMLLTNEQATTGQLGAALDWLMEESQPGDQGDCLFFRARRCRNKNQNEPWFFIDLRFSGLGLHSK